MEGRVMLSATAPQTAPFEIYSVQLTASTFHFAPAGGQEAVAGPLIDGGLINGDDLNSIPRTTGSFGVPLGVDPNSIDSAITLSEHFNTSGNSGFQSYEPTYDSSGLQPVVIVSSNNGIGLEPNITPIIAGPSAGAGGASEGGAIPIGNVLAGLRNSDGLAVGETSLSQLTSGKAAERRLSARLAATSESAMSGEWARAMVFEIAGGEPDSGANSSLGEQRESSRSGEAAALHGKPLSEIETSGPQFRFANRRVDSAQSDERPRSIEGGQNRTGQPAGNYAPVADPINLSGATAPLIEGAPGNSASPQTTAPSSVGDSASANSAASAAVDQLVADKAAFVESSSAGFTWSRLAGAAPLLMVLAMERIAVRNSRRAAKDTSRPVGPKAAAPA